MRSIRMKQIFFCWEALLVVGIVTVARGKQNKHHDGILAYIEHYRQHYDAVIASFTDEVSNLRNEFSLRADGIYLQRDLLWDKISEVNDQMKIFKVRSIESHSCYEEHHADIPKALAARTAIAKCVSNCLIDISNFWSKLESTQKKLQNFYHKTFWNLLLDCEKQHGNTTAEYDLCVLDAVNTTTTYTQTSKQTFTTQAHHARCEAETLLREAHTCAFNVVYDTAKAYSEARAMLETCIEEAAVEEKQCENVVMLDAEQDFTNATIPNPFLNVAGNATCVLFQF